MIDEMVITGVLLPTTNVSDEEQDVVSVIVTEKEPALRFVRSSVVAPLDHRKVYVPGGFTDRSMDPLGEVQDVYLKQELR